MHGRSLRPPRGMNTQNMKNKLVSVISLCLLLSACTRGAATPSAPEVVIEKIIGEEFRLVLESNPSTGYHWEAMGGLDSQVVELINKYYQSTNEVTLVGGGGVEIWVFRAAGKGETTITLGYYPPSNSGAEPEKTQTFTVIVDDEDF